MSEETTVIEPTPTSEQANEAEQKATGTGEVKLVKMADIVLNPDLQAREKLSRETVEDYAEAYRTGAKMPALRLFHVADEYVLVDGFHRFNAMKRLGFEDTEATIEAGSLADAMLAAAASNSRHGLRRTKGDARRAAIIATNALLSINPRKRPTVDKVAELAGVGRSTVEAAFADMTAAGVKLGAVDKRGRKATVNVESETTHETGTGEGDGTGLPPDDRHPLIRQAEASRDAADIAATHVRVWLSEANASDIEPGSDNALAWLAVANVYESLAAEIRAKLEAVPEPSEGQDQEAAA